MELYKEILMFIGSACVVSILGVIILIVGSWIEDKYSQIKLRLYQRKQDRKRTKRRVIDYTYSPSRDIETEPPGLRQDKVYQPKEDIDTSNPPGLEN